MKLSRAPAAAVALALIAASAPARADLPGPTDPLAGFAGDQAFLRSPDNRFLLFPDAELALDLLGFVRPTDQMPENTLLLRRARLELAGWVGPAIHFHLSGDFAPAQSPPGTPQGGGLLGSTTDNYIGFAPLQDIVILQGGQFDAPFTFENRTSDKYIDFRERSLTVRALGVPTNKEMGLMVHGAFLKPLLPYAFAIVNGDGQNFRALEDHFDVMGRIAFHPLEITPLRAATTLSFGASFWHGFRAADALVAAPQLTQGGLTLLDTHWTQGGAGGDAYTLRQGPFNALALELNAPVLHRFGIRTEYVLRFDQSMTERDEAHPTDDSLTGHPHFGGHSFYVSGWWWILGSDRLLPEPASQLPTRALPTRAAPPEHGLMVTARVEHLYETLRSDKPALGDPAAGVTDVVALQFAGNYWYSKRFRATTDYTLHVLGGNAGSIDAARGANGGRRVEHEFGARVAVML